MKLYNKNRSLFTNSMILFLFFNSVFIFFFYPFFTIIYVVFLSIYLNKIYEFLSKFESKSDIFLKVSVLLIIFGVLVLIPFNPKAIAEREAISYAPSAPSGWTTSKLVESVKRRGDEFVIEVSTQSFLDGRYDQRTKRTARTYYVDVNNIGVVIAFCIWGTSGIMYTISYIKSKSTIK
jgi:hypothetical protein